MEARVARVMERLLPQRLRLRLVLVRELDPEEVASPPPRGPSWAVSWAVSQA